MPTPDSHPVVMLYFDADARRDVEAILALFSDDAVVIDEGQTWRGRAVIRDWRLGPASKYEYTTELTRVEEVGDNRYRAEGRISGNFPGGSAELNWDFTLAGERIIRLEIAPP